jgi:hypothetical protein
MADSELDAFKTAIDLRQLAASKGYQLDPRESWRGSAVMRQGGDKIIIKRANNGHYVYCSVRDETDNGTVIDFLQKRGRPNLGEVRKELRRWIGASGERPPLPLADLPALEKTSPDRLAVQAAFEKAHDDPACSYLEETRALPAGIGSTPRFRDRVRLDERKNVLFPHFDDQGLCGFELKNRNFTGFSEGGTKGLWLSHQTAKDRRLVLCESGIECLSHATLFADALTRYASIGGKPSPVQLSLIAWQIGILPAGEVVASMNADAEGRKLAEVVRQAFDQTHRGDLTFRIQEPELEGSDWNDLLKSRHSESPLPLPTALLIEI